MIRIVVEGLALGLSTGSYCLGACFVFFMPYLLVEGRPRIPENLKKIAAFLLGRLIAYVGFALAVGLLGAGRPDLFSAKFSHLSLVIVSLLMLSYALIHQFGGSSSCKNFFERFRLTRMPFFLGLFSGLSPCLPFLVGMTRLWTLHDIGAGVLLFAAFFVGTSVFMIPLIFISFLNRLERFKRIGLMLAVLSSLWFLGVGLTGLLSSS